MRDTALNQTQRANTGAFFHAGKGDGMKTPDSFVTEYTGKAIDYDGAYGVQCVDGFKVGCRYLGIPVMSTPNNWADGYWTGLNANGLPN